MKAEVIRSNNKDVLLIREDGVKKTISYKKLLDRFKTTNIIRIRKEEYNNIPTPSFDHFNLQVTNHKVGEKYVLPKILEQGFFDSTKEQPPTLSLTNVYVAECIKVQNNISYDDLTEDDFKHSMKHIQNKEELQQTILTRYKKSMPHLTTKEILELGVAKTTLKILCVT